jgi:hypothetical protein
MIVCFGECAGEDVEVFGGVDSPLCLGAFGAVGMNVRICGFDEIIIVLSSEISCAFDLLGKIVFGASATVEAMLVGETGCTRAPQFGQ